MTQQLKLEIIDDCIVLTEPYPSRATPIVISGKEFYTANLSRDGILSVLKKDCCLTFENVTPSREKCQSRKLITIANNRRLLVFGVDVVRSAVLFRISSNEKSRERLRAILETYKNVNVELPAEKDCVFCSLINGRNTTIYGAPSEMEKLHKFVNEKIVFDDVSIPVFCGK